MDAIGLENTVVLEPILAKARGNVMIVCGHVHGVYQGHIGSHAVMTAPSTCSAFALDLRTDAPIGFFKGPTGFAVIDTGSGGVWSALPLDAADGPFPF